MLTAKLLFQCLAGITVVGGMLGGGYYVVNSSETTPEYKYLIATASTVPSTKPTKELITTSNNVDTKNYSCEININSFDEDCEIFKINTTTDEKTIDFEKVLDETSKLKLKTNLNVNKHYVLKLTKDKYLKLADKKTINVVSNIDSQTNKKYTELTIKHVVGENLSTIESNLIIVQSTLITSSSSGTATINDKLECKIEGQKDFFKCNIYKATSDKTTNDFGISDFSQITKTSTDNDIKPKNYYVLDLKDQKFIKEELRNKKITLQYKENNSADATHISDFVFEQLVLGDVTATPKIGFPVSPSNEIYYVSKLSDDSSKITITKDLYETSASGTKNFKCKLSNVTENGNEDVACEIFAMPEFDTTNKLIQFAQLKSANTLVTTKNKFTTDKYFKLKINTNNMSSLNWTDSADLTIDIVSTTADQEGKYASLKLLIKEEKEKLHGQTNLVVGKATGKATSNTVTGTFTCKVGTSGTAQKCDVYKFTTQLQNNQTNEHLNFAASSKATAISEITDTYSYFIDLKENKYNLTTDVDKNVIVVVQDDSNKFNLTIESAMIGEVSETANNNKLIFLK